MSNVKNIIIPLYFFGNSQSCELQTHHSYQKKAKAELTSVDKKFAYHIANIFFKVIILIHFILS
jgi:hypothetical protein